MTKKEVVNHNIGLTFDFIRYLIKNPDAIKNLPNKFTIEFLENDFAITENKTQNRDSKVKYYQIARNFVSI